MIPSIPTSDDSWLEVTCSRHLAGWMAEHNLSLACTTYQTGKLLLFGRKNDAEIAVFERTFNRCMGLWADGQTLWMSSLYQLWRIENTLRPGETYNGHDRLYVPRIGYTTGDIDIHDIVVEANGRVVFAATGLNCLGTPCDRYNLTPLWQPSFISRLAAEDRCHLNGLAVEDGACRYATAVSTTDVIDGWRERRRDGGVLIEIPSSRVIAGGLSMPHSPRVYRSDLWFLNSGTGSFARLDKTTGRAESIAFCPGYLRGLAFVGNYAVVGLSRPRHEKTFAGLPLDDELARRGIEARCGLFIIDLRTGNVAHWIRLEGMVSELYDVAILPGVQRPMAFGFKTDEIQRTIAIGDQRSL